MAAFRNELVPVAIGGEEDDHVLVFPDYVVVGNEQFPLCVNQGAGTGRQEAVALGRKDPGHRAQGLAIDFFTRDVALPAGHRGNEAHGECEKHPERSVDAEPLSHMDMLLSTNSLHHLYGNPAWRW